MPWPPARPWDRLWPSPDLPLPSLTFPAACLKQASPHPTFLRKWDTRSGRALGLRFARSAHPPSTSLTSLFSKSSANAAKGPPVTATPEGFSLHRRSQLFQISGTVPCRGIIFYHSSQNFHFRVTFSFVSPPLCYNESRIKPLPACFPPAWAFQYSDVVLFRGHCS